MNTIDVNCDMGEGIGNEAAIFPYISSASIACGYHAGDEHTMRDTIRKAKVNQVNIGIHPSFKDLENFGRTMHSLPPGDIYTLITEQLVLFKKIAQYENAVIAHIKPHGALYNLSAKDPHTAGAIAHAVKDFDNGLLLYGLSGSHSIIEAKALGLQTIAEVFADRTYEADGSLTPRSSSGATIHHPEAMLQQVLQMVLYKTVTSTTGVIVPIEAESICIHSDGPHAPEFAKQIFETLQRNHIAVKAWSSK